jgi:hypothetical protein
LLRAAYPNAPTPYPQLLNGAAFEGVLLHHLIDAFARHVAHQTAAGMSDYATIRASFPVRRIAQEALRTPTSLVASPRVDASRLAARVSIDAVVNAFRSVARLYARISPGGAAVRRKQDRTRGTEVWITVAAPRLCGRIDYLDDQELVDFKTGDASEDHLEQLRFYALIAWLATSIARERMTLEYVRAGRRVTVEAPSVEALDGMASALTEEVERIEAAVKSGVAPAKPDVTNCRFCPVRQLCDAYWQADNVAEVRLGPASLVGIEPVWRDVQVDELPPTSAGSAIVGQGRVAGVGRVFLRVGPSHLRSSANAPGCGARLLSALVEQKDDVLHVTATTATEVFWTDAHS